MGLGAAFKRLPFFFFSFLFLIFSFLFLWGNLNINTDGEINMGEEGGERAIVTVRARGVERSGTEGQHSNEPCFFR